MKTIICDFKRSSLGVIGEENEHNAIELLFNLPKDFEAADYIHVEFDTMDGDPFARDTFEFNKEEMTLRGRLDQKVMKAGELKIQLVGYAIDEEGTIDEIAKSPVIKAIISNSVNGIITEGDANPSMIELLKAKLDKLLEGGINVEGGGALPVAYINEEGELIFELGEGITNAYINSKGELELQVKTEDGNKTFNLGKVKGRTPYFQLNDKVLEVKYDDETSWAALVDFSIIASTFDLRLNEDTYFLEAQREVNGEWEPMVDLSALKLAHEHSNKDVLDKITSSVFEQVKDAISKRHKHDNIDSLNQINDEHIQNINKISQIEEDVEELVNNPSKQLVEGFINNYNNEGIKGYSANPDAIPISNRAWIEGKAAPILEIDDWIDTAQLNVSSSTSGKSTTTTAKIEFGFKTIEYRIKFSNLMATYVSDVYTTGRDYNCAAIIFENEPEQTYYVRLQSVNSNTNLTHGMSFTFVFYDNQKTFPINSSQNRTIKSIWFYANTGEGSHNEGKDTIAIGQYAHAEGLGTRAVDQYSHVQGKYNDRGIEDGKTYAHVVGNGTDDEHRSNAHTLDWEGNAWYAGNIEADGIKTYSIETNSIKADNFIINSFEEATRRKIEYGTDTIPAYIPYSGNPFIRKGEWYAITINGIESIFLCEADWESSVLVGDYAFNSTSADGHPPDGYMYITGNTSGSSISWTLEHLELASVDLLSYINEIKDSIPENIEIPEIPEWAQQPEKPTYTAEEVGALPNNIGLQETITANAGARHTHNNKSTLDKVTETHLTNIASNTSARHTHSNKEALDKVGIDNNGKLLFNNKSLPSNIIINKIEEASNNISLNANTLTYINKYSPEIILEDFPAGDSYISFVYDKGVKLDLPRTVYWENGICPSLCLRKGTPRIIMKFTAQDDYSWNTYITGSWYIIPSNETTFTIDNRLLPQNVNCNFAKIDGEQIIFAPQFTSSISFNDEEWYLSNGYKKVLGEDPYEVSATLNTNDECILKFKEYDEYIIVYWIIVPRGYGLGKYVDMDLYSDWSSRFYKYEGDTINDLLIGALDTSNGTKFNSAFSYCSNLIEVPVLDLRKAESCSYMFRDCFSLKTISKLKFNSIPTSKMEHIFDKCENLENITVEGSIKVDSNFNLFYYSNILDGSFGYNKVTVDSIMSFLNAFEDNTGEETQYTVTIGFQNLYKLTDDQKAVALNKNILLA